MLQVCHINLAKGYRGGERQTELLIRALCSRDKVMQRLVVRKDSPLVNRFRDIKNGLDLQTVSKPYIFNAHLTRDCNLVHAHETKASQMAYLATRIFKQPYLITRRVPNRIKPNPFTRRIYFKAGKLVALSGAIRDVLQD